LIELAETPLLTMARPFAAPPGVPDERARALQAAFLAAHRDAELRAEAARLGIDISPVGAEDMVRSIEQMTRTSPEAFDYMKRLLASHKGN
jgi:tripartite-type tricarboxylate transporter receptor subunit TctC